MARRKDDWQPNPACEAALGRVTRTAQICAASLFGEPACDDLAERLTPQAARQAAGMMYFLARISPDDIAALFAGPGSLADIAYTPFPPDHRPRGGLFRVAAG